jgi:hypothetical protein
MTIRPLLLTDADGVLLDFVQGFSRYIGSLGYDISHTKRFWKTSQHTTFKHLMNIDDPKRAEQVKAGFYQSNAVAKLPILQPELAHIIPYLSKHVDIVCLTCIGRAQPLVDARTQNLYDLFGDSFKAIHCLDYGESKLPLLLHYKKQNPLAYLDDRQVHVSEALQAGIDGRIFEYNIPKTQNNSVTCWKQFSDEVIESLYGNLESTR